MSHIDAPYNFGKRVEPHWIALRPIIEPHIVKDGRPVFPNMKGSSEISLEDCFRRATAVTDRDLVLFHRYAELNRLLFENLDELSGRDIIFTDGVTPVVHDPRFLFSYLKSFKIPYPRYAPAWFAGRRSAERVMHDPFSHMCKLSDVVLFLAKSNPDAWDRKIVWPVSPVALPFEVDSDGLIIRYIFPELFESVSSSEMGDKRVGLGSCSKSFDEANPFSRSVPKVASFESNPLTYDRDALYDLFVQNEEAFRSEIVKLVRYHGIPASEARDFFVRELPYRTFLKREFAAVFYSLVFESLDIRKPVLYAAKGSNAFRILERAVNLANLRNGKFLDTRFALDILGYEDKGPMESVEMSAYNILDRSAIERLNGHVVHPWVASSRGFMNRVSPVSLDDEVEFSLKPCPFAPVFCESVYDGSCARTAGECKSCSRDLFDAMKDPDFFKELGRDWISQYNEANKPIGSIADLVRRKCAEHKFFFYSAEHVAWLLNRGENFLVYTSADFVNGKRIFDSRRSKGRLSWDIEKGDDVIFPLVHAGSLVKSPFCRISSLGVSCDVARIFSVDQRAVVPSSEAAAFGTAGHFLMNGTLGRPLLQEQLWATLNMPVVARDQYTEREVSLAMDDAVWSGHSDCVFAKGPDLRTMRDLVIVDYKTSAKTYYPRPKYALQLGAYALCYDQMFPGTFRNFFLVVVNRPFVSDFSVGAPFNQTVTVVKIENREGDYLYDLIRSELRRTVREQRLLLSDRDYFMQYVGRKMSKGACDVPELDFTKAGCFDDQRARCFCARNCDSLEAYLDG